MRTTTAEGFASGVMSRFDRLSRSEIIKASRSASSMWAPIVEAPAVGHPDFAALGVGETATCQLVVGFLDMRAMTARSFWEPLTTVANLSLAVLGQVAQVVEESGGHVLGMRGDGLMAGWGGPGSNGRTDVYLAMAACAFSLDAVRGAVNQMLELSGIEPVQICAGADWGDVCFARTGTPEASEVNIVGHPANFAAKCEKAALSWEVVVGEGAAKHITSSDLLVEHQMSPKTYQHAGQRLDYRFYGFRWQSILNDAASAIDQVSGSPTKSVNHSF